MKLTRNSVFTAAIILFFLLFTGWAFKATYNEHKHENIPAIIVPDMQPKDMTPRDLELRQDDRIRNPNSPKQSTPVDKSSKQATI